MLASCTGTAANRFAATSIRRLERSSALHPSTRGVIWAVGGGRKLVSKYTLPVAAIGFCLFVLPSVAGYGAPSAQPAPTVQPAPGGLRGKLILELFARGDENEFGRLYVVGVKGGKPRRVVRAYSERASWSPDGRRIAYRELGGDGIHVANADGSNDHQVVNGISQPRWSPDGRKLVYERAFVLDIAIVDVGARRQRPRPLGHRGVDPDWSADGKSVVFVWPEVGNPLAVFDLRSRRLRELKGTAAAAEPRWSANGRRIFFVRRYGPECCGLYSINRDGTHLRKLVDMPNSNVRASSAVSWSPDNRTVVYCNDNDALVSLRVVAGAVPHPHVIPIPSTYGCGSVDFHDAGEG